MNLRLNRFEENDMYQYGILSDISGMGRKCFTLENGFKQKYIPSGVYPISLRMVKSPLTLKYREKFPWFKWHLMVGNVPNAEYVYIHIGNTEKDTDSCICVANTCDLTPQTKHGFIGESTSAYKELYLRTVQVIESGEPVYIVIE